MRLNNHLWIIFEYCAGGDLFYVIGKDEKVIVCVMLYLAPRNRS